MIDISKFLSYPKALVVAPAGYGKTHFIVEAIKFCSGKSLILTHTHAGVASLRQKLNKEKVDPEKYNLETISSFAQKYVHAYVAPENIPRQEDQKEYFKFILTKATEIFLKKIFQEVIRKTYTGVFVDEYQDCSQSHHAMILAISQEIPLRVLGDPLQGIFDFDEPLVNFEADLSVFEKFELVTPWRWYQSNPKLGADLQNIRNCIETNRNIDWAKITSIQYCNARINRPQEIILQRNKYVYTILNVIKKEDLLIISSQASARGVRLSLAQQLGGKFQLLEAIDDKNFYLLASKLDTLSVSNFYNKFREICLILFNKAEIDKWLGENKLKRKRNKSEQNCLFPLEEIISSIREDNLCIKMYDAVECIKSLPKIHTFVHEQLYNILTALKIAHSESVPVLHAMRQIRNLYRCKGRVVPHYAIGTTLLTKGLEFDNVLVLNPNKMDPKHFYVAITRTRKRLFLYQDGF